MDGVLYRGERPLPGAKEFLERLEARGKPYILVTNNSSRTPQEYVAKLRAMGIEVREERILTSALATAEYLSQVLPPGVPIYVIGERGLQQAVSERGFVLAEQGVRAVVAGMDRQLKLATLAIRAGALFIGSNPDISFPAEEGIVPGAGAVLAAIEVASGVKPVVMGKPEPGLFTAALGRIGASPQETAIIGDRLETDILGGQRCGLTTILVLTGISQEEDLAKSETRA
jgi:4-nitrophenyl phosphatase